MLSNNKLHKDNNVVFALLVVESLTVSIVPKLNVRTPPAVNLGGQLCRFNRKICI